jgi:hypothetical protein
MSIKIKKKFSLICDNHRGYQNQLQDLIKNRKKKWKKVHSFVKTPFAIFLRNFAIFQIFLAKMVHKIFARCAGVYNQTIFKETSSDFLQFLNNLTQCSSFS